MKREIPVGPLASKSEFGSDIVAEAIRATGIKYIALNPGASFRGLHDSLVNRLGNEDPTMLLCLHEEHAVAIAHGYAKVTGEPMAVALHSNVGLLHASMAIFNAWCDRAPVVIVGAIGPLDARKRRPWIDWIHTAVDQAAIVRSFTKWDDQPASVGAAHDSILRAAWISTSAPKGPVFISLDVDLQEQAIQGPIPVRDARRYLVPAVPGADPRDVEHVAARLKAAKKPLILVGRVSRCPENWRRRVAIAEALQAKVLTDLKVGAGFPTDHPLHTVVPTLNASPSIQSAVRDADLILSLDWVDLSSTLHTATVEGPTAEIIQVSLDYNSHQGWSMDSYGHPPVDRFVAADPDRFTEALYEALCPQRQPSEQRDQPQTAAPSALADTNEKLSSDLVTIALREAVAGRETTVLRVPSMWNAALWPFRHPLDYVGFDGGGGIGSGPGMAVGSALALKDTGRLPIAAVGDGDFLMGATAVWTAVKYRIPLLVVVYNDQCYYNDELHQERVAIHRGRPVENKWIGQRMIDPTLDIAGMARSQGAAGYGPVKSIEDLRRVLAEAISHVSGGGVAVVDVHAFRSQPQEYRSK